MSDHQGYAFPPAAGYGAYMVIRGIMSLFQEPKHTSQPPPPARARASIITPPPARPVVASPPMTRWTEDRELLAWRGWRLATLMSASGADDGPRLLSLSAPCIWNGPVVHAGIPRETVETPSGIYALKADVADRSQWETSEHCWVTGSIALSGCVVEHALGYRAERAVVRELRLSVGTHLAVRSLAQLKQLMGCLEDRYQVSVDVGAREREIADRLLMHGKKPQCAKLPFVWAKPPWRLI